MNSGGDKPAIPARLSPPCFGDDFELNYSYLTSFSERKRVTFVPHTGQVPLAIGRPFAVLATSPFLTCRFSRHLTQYPLKSMFDLLSR